jgi:hypothetical protein
MTELDVTISRPDAERLVALGCEVVDRTTTEHEALVRLAVALGLDPPERRTSAMAALSLAVPPASLGVVFGLALLGDGEWTDEQCVAMKDVAGLLANPGRRLADA